MLARKLGVSADYLETGSEIRDTEERELRIGDAELELRLADDTGEAERKLESLRREALEAGDTLAASRASIALGLAAAHAGHNHEAIKRLQEGLELAEVSPAVRPDVYATLGRALAASGETQRAVDIFEHCLEDVSRETPEDLTAQVRFTTYLSYALTDLGDLQRAEDVLQDAIAKAEETTDAYSRVRLYWSVARLSDAQGRAADALIYIRRAIALLDVTDDTLHLARAHLLAGSIMLTQGNVKGAGRHYDLAERLFGPSAQPDDLANLYADQSKLAAQHGDADEAIRRAEAAVDAASDEYLRERGSALWALADAKALKGDVDGANEAFRQATELLRDHGHHRDHVEAYRAWGKFLRRAGREEQALEVLEQATDLAAEPSAVEAHRLR